jgi:MoxR-like ATPase
VFVQDDWDLLYKVAPVCSKILLHSESPGLGKSTFFRWLCEQKKNQGYIVPLTEETPKQELQGFWTRKSDGSFGFHHGPGTLAWSEGKPILFDEIHRLNGEIEAYLHSYLDDTWMAEMTLPTGETVKPREGFMCLATMNGSFEDLDDALLDRFPVRFSFTTPDPKAILALPDDLQNAAKSSVMHRDVNQRVGLRKWFAYDRLRSRVDKQTAGKAIFGNRWEAVLDSLDICST